QWKLLWKLVSGNHYDTPLEDVDDKLSEVVDELRQGLKQYGKNTTKSDEKLREVVKEAGQEKLLSFCQRLQHFLDIDALQTWSLLCSYLLTEYRGAPNSLSLYTANEESMMQFLQDIWKFYSMERMVVLKIVRNILEFHKSHVHPYADAYDKVLMEIDVKKLRESLLSQLEMLIKEPPPSTSSSFGKQLFNKIPQWCERKLKEINEILHLLILVVHFDGISVKEFKQLLDLFKYHSFGRQQQYIERSSHEELANKINFSEVALFICCVNISSRKDSEEWLLEVQKLDKEILGMHQQPEHGPILLFWMLLNFRLAITRIDEELMRKYTRCGGRATQLGVFQYLTQMIREPMFQEMSLLAKIVRTCIYENLGFLCELFDEDGSVGMKPGVFDLLAELLKTPKISGEFCSCENAAVRSLFNTAIEYFPEDILPLAQLATSLTTSGANQYAFVRDHLMTLPVYTEAQSQKQFDLRQHTEVDEYILGSDYTPFPDIPYVIRKGTIVVVIDKKDHTLMHFKAPLDFFHVLHHEMNELMRELQEFTVIREKRIERVTAGIKFLVAVLKRIKSPEDINESMVFPTEEVLILLARLREVQDPSMELMSCCLDVCTALIPLFPNEILRRVINTNILPTIPNRTLSYVEYARAVSFNSGSLGYYLVNAETTSGKYDFLKAYFRFLKAVSVGDGDVEKMFNVELPGLLFLLHAVFPHCHSWKFLEKTDKSTVYIFALEHFLRILQDGVSGKIHRRLLVDVTIFSLLNLDCGLTLLRFVGVGNGNLEALVQAETNWMMIANSGLNLIIQLSMTILMHILKQKVTLESDTKSLSPLESVIYTQPKQRDPLRIIPVVTSYMDNIFNRRLPLLACRLLRRFAIEFRMSLLACLDMDADHIRVVFLQRLRDEAERDDVKIAILEFVEACIDCQPGLVEAFFSVSNDRRGLLGIKSTKKLHILTEGIPVYMTEYLNVVHKDPEKIANPLLSRIMSLFHAIWRNNMQSLVGTLVASDTFWPSLCSPLFTTINPTVKAYSQLFNIMGIEAFKANTAEAMPLKLKECFVKFLKPDTFTKWLEIIFTFDDNDDNGEGDVPEWLCRLQSFKDLMVVLLRRNYPEIPVKCKKVLIRICFQRLVTKAKAADDFRPVIILAELFLVSMENSLGKFVDNEKEDRELLKNSADLLNCLALSYDDIHVRAREAILGATIEITRALPDDLVDDVETTRSLLCATMDIICTELMDVERKVRQKTTEITNRGFSLILAMHLLRNILMILEKNQINVWHGWLESYKMANRLLSAVNGIFHSHEHRKITTELLNLLVILAKTLRPDYLLHCDVVYYLWLNLLPPRELNQSLQSVQTTGKWHTQDWLPIYTRGVELVAVLLQRNTHIFFRDAINFVGVHEEFLIASIMLAKESLEANALALIKTVLDLVYEMAKYHRLWRLEHPQSMMNIMVKPFI
uniref:Nucleoporin NUP188 n=1 Tax=Phlebotomus papatasi TaxID=29031 RepID=A0A1B0DHP3_PHLPP